MHCLVFGGVPYYNFIILQFHTFNLYKTSSQTLNYIPNGQF